MLPWSACSADSPAQRSSGRSNSAHTAPFMSLLFSRGGLSWFGGFLGGVGAGLWSLHRRRIPLVPALAAASPALAVGHAIGRIGCFMVGDDYGRPTDLPWGIAFPRGLPPTTVPVHPDAVVRRPPDLRRSPGCSFRWRRGRSRRCYRVRALSRSGRSAAISHRIHPRQCARSRALDAGAIILCGQHGCRLMVRAQPEGSSRGRAGR